MRRPLSAVVVALVACCAAGCASAPEAPPKPPVTAVPGQILDLRNWNLTLPTGNAGKPDTIQQPQLATFSNPYFEVDAARDGVVFTAVTGGVTTKNSGYPRSELREMDGGKRAEWSNRSGTHTMELRQAVTTLPPVKPEVVTAQIHDEDSDVLEVRLEGNRLLASYDDAKGEFVIDPAYVLGTPYDLRVVAGADRIDVFYNGAHAGAADVAGTGWYFKTGSYVQSNPEKGDAPDAVARVVLYALRVTHTA